MITNTEFSNEFNIDSSYKGVRAVARELGYALPHNYGTMAAIKDRINFNTKHLKTGDALPPLNSKLRLFAMRYCPYAHRSVLVLNAKKLQYDLVFINLKQKPEWIFDFNPRGAVPTLEYEPGKAINDSMVINVYLDEKYPEVPLQSSDPLRRAQDKLIIANFSPVENTYYAAAYKSDLQPSAIETFYKALESLQKEIEARGTKFLHGDEPGLVDYTIWPPLERLGGLPLLGRTDLAIDKSKFEILLTYIESMKNSPAVKAYYLSPETHVKFDTIKGDINYDIGSDTGAACGFRPRKKKE